MLMANYYRGKLLSGNAIDIQHVQNAAHANPRIQEQSGFLALQQNAIAFATAGYYGGLKKH
jgi:hypothetical protein